MSTREEQLRDALAFDGEPLEHALVEDGTVLLVAAAGRLSALDARLLVERVVDPAEAPDNYVVVDRIPRDGDGATGDGWRDVAVEHHRYAAPASPLEEAVAAIWADGLGVPRVGVEDDFLDLGGDSFAAVAIVDRMEQECGISVFAADLYQLGTVRQLAAQAEVGTAR
ncbi:phosphopantetheine-binding protein [Micromonospora sp. NPDC092111]|uniref:phosphopantetheine-binding protein n=1 Tax=Micromonospora sp. NPDC092111 TaxID=3364289 RepID=UPI00382FE892